MKQVAFYLIAHQPRRLRLPAPDLAGLSLAEMVDAVHDDAMNRHYLERVAELCYRPVLAMLRESGWKASLAVTDTLLWQARRWAPDVARAFTHLPESVERVGVSPQHGFLFRLDPNRFSRAMRRYRGQVTDTTEMWLSEDVATALHQAGCLAALADRSPHLGLAEGAPLTASLAGLPVILRHRTLSDDVGYRFSDRSAPGWPLTADGFAARLKEAPEACGLIGWDLETFGEHYHADTGILDFLSNLPRALEQAGVQTVPVSALARLGPPLPAFGACTWAGTGTPDVFFSTPVQRQVWALLEEIWQLAKGAPAKAAALWFTQSDIFHMLYWAAERGPLADVSSYFTPEPWRQAGPAAFASEVVRVYSKVRAWFLESEGGQRRD